MTSRIRILAACIAGLTLAGNALAATVTLVADQWCPYNCEPGSERPGFMVEIAKRVLARGGHTVEYKTLPWARAVLETRRGDHDGVIAASRDGSAKDFVFPDLPVANSVNVFLVRHGDPWRYTGPDSLAAVSIGVVLNYSYEHAFDAYLAAHRNDPTRVQTEPGDGALARNLRKLATGKIGTLVENQAVLEYQLAQNGERERFEFAGVLTERASYIAFSPAKPSSGEYARLLSDGIAALRKSGELERILAKYSLRDWAP